MTVAIIDYGSGNLRSAAKAFERAAEEIGISETVVVTSDAKQVADADRVVLPGVGAFGDCLAGLEAVPGMRDALDSAVTEAGRPFLGICVGMQLMADRGTEHGTHAGFGWIPGEVRPIEPADPDLKIPHMGWNELTIENRHPVLDGLDSGVHCYYVHSYQLYVDQPEHRLARTDYAGPITAVVGRDNVVGTQFHPEKSQQVGLRLIGNFLKWRP
jgi:glutamine amidotransferase